MKVEGKNSVVIDTDMLGTTQSSSSSCISISNVNSNSTSNGVSGTTKPTLGKGEKDIETKEGHDDDQVVEQIEVEQSAQHADSRVIELEFVLGDFDETPIAKAEEQLREMADDGTRQGDGDDDDNNNGVL